MDPKYMVKKMRSSQDVKPEQLKVPEIIRADVEKNQTVHDRIEEEIQDLKSMDDLPDKRYFDGKVGKLQRQLRELNEKQEAIKEVMEMVLLQYQELTELMRKAQEIKPKAWQKLFGSSE